MIVSVYSFFTIIFQVFLNSSSECNQKYSIKNKNILTSN